MRLLAPKRGGHMTTKENKEDAVSKGAMKRILGFACFAICLFSAMPAGAAIVNPNCAVLNGFDIVISPTTVPGPGHLVINSTDDVVLTCLLDGKSVLIRAHSITVDNTGFPNLGAIHTVNKEGIKLFAGLDSTSNKCGDPTVLNAPPDPTAQIHILNAILQDDNPNGGIKFTSCGNIEITSASTLTSNGANIRGECLYPSDPSIHPYCT